MSAPLLGEQLLIRTTMVTLKFQGIMTRLHLLIHQQLLLKTTMAILTSPGENHSALRATPSPVHPVVL
jgi:hypothetical protein